MKVPNGKKGLFKKAIAVTLGIMMAFGTMMLPVRNAEDSFTKAAAADYPTMEYKGVVFYIDFTQKTGSKTAMIKGISPESKAETVEIPLTFNHRGVDYPITRIDNEAFKGNKTIKTLIVNDNIKQIGVNVLKDSNIEKVVLPDCLQELGHSFCNNCPNLESIECDYIDMSSYDFEDILRECPKMYNEKGALCIANWLIDYKPAEGKTVKELKIADLGNDGIKIDSIGNYAIREIEGLETVDLKGIKNLGEHSFDGCKALKKVINGDSVNAVNGYVFFSTPWFDTAKPKGIIKLGSALLYYHTDLDTLDLTSDEFEDISCIASYALFDCAELTTLKCSSDLRIAQKAFYIENPSESMVDPLPRTPTYKIKNIYLDGKKLEFSKEEPKMDTWFKTNYYAFERTQWLDDNVQAKAKAIFEQMDLPYYGPHNDEIGTLTPTEEFYAAMKIHGYISTMDVDNEYLFPPALVAFLCSEKVNCGGYARVADFLYECAGVEAQIMITDKTAVHAWNQVRIGNDWYTCDPGWDEQIAHGYSWFGLSSVCPQVAENEAHKKEDGKAYNWHNGGSMNEYHVGRRLIGDLNSDMERTQQDVDALWHNVQHPNSFNQISSCDINFDGTIDVTDAVLLDNIVNGTVIKDTKNIQRDSLALGFQAVFINGMDRESVQYEMTDRDGYLVLPECMYEAPEGMKFQKYNIGKPGQKVKIPDPFTVIQPVWVDKNAPDESSEPEDSSKPDSSSKPDGKKYQLGDVNGDGSIDIIDAVSIISQINGLTPLKADEEKRADVSKDGNIDIDDAVVIISYVNGNSTF